MKHNHPKIEIMDTTLRDGEQTSGVSFVPHEKLMIARLLLEDLKADRVEVASARVSEGEFDAVKMICDWAARRNMLPRVEVLGFVDGHTSVDWIHATGCRVINLLCKGSLKHCSCQLKKLPEEHIEDILAVVDYANVQDMEVNVYLEDWSNGMKDSPEYVFQLMDALIRTNIKRYMLPDTLGVLNPLQVIEFMRKMVKRYPHAHFDFHAHNDYDLAVSNVLAAVLSGCKGLHTTINGLGERAGNAPLASVQAILKDHFSAVTNIDESRLNDVSRVVESYSGIVIPANKPIGKDAGHVFHEAAPGDVGHALDAHRLEDFKNGLHVNAGGFHDAVGEGRPVKGHFPVGAGDFHHLADQREAVRVRAARSETQNHVAFVDRGAVDDFVLFNDAHGKARQVVVIGTHDTGVLGHLATH